MPAAKFFRGRICMSYEDYTWLRYYEDLYHRQKKNNNALAVQLGESQAKAEELTISLNRVIGSPFWKVLAPARKIYGRLKGSDASVGTSAPGKGAASDAGSTDAGSVLPDGHNAVTEAQRGYQNRLELLEDYYGQWIKNDRFEQLYPDRGDLRSPDGESSDDGHTDDGNKEGGKNEGCVSFAYTAIEDCVGDNNPLHKFEDAQWLVFTGKNGCIAAGFEKRAAEALAGNDRLLIAYADEDYYYDEPQEDGGTCKRRLLPNFKPDWSPDTLDGFFYLGNIFMLERSLADNLKWLGSDNAYANVYDLLLQAAERVGKHYDAEEVMHIPQVLFHNSAAKYAEAAVKTNSTRYETWKSVLDALNEDLAVNKLVWGFDEAFNEVKLEALKRRGLKGKFLEGQFPGTQQLCLDVPDRTKVSALILTKDHPEMLMTCIDSFIERTDFDQIEFITVDNGSSEAHKAEYEAYFEKLSADYACKYIYRPMAFNFSAMCNIAAANASGNLYLFMNDDIEIVEKDWLRIMAGYACLPHIGAVGAKLLYAGTDKIQHVGVTSLEIGPSHKLVIFPDDRSHYFGKNVFNADMLGVTAACLLIEADKYRKAGGFNEEFAVAYNDVDFCMKLAEAGFNNLQCNAALLYHYESMTRGLDAEDAGKWDRLLHEKEKLYLIHNGYYKHDPYYNCNLIGNHSLYLSNYDFGYNNHLKNAIVEQLDAGKLAEHKSADYKISVDFAGLQEKENLGEADIICVRGWSFAPGKDNCSVSSRVILKSEDEKYIFSVETDLCPRDDLENVFKNEKNIRLCGFVARMLREDLPEGRYRVGIEPVMLKHDLTDFEPSGEVIFTDTFITI